MNTKGNVVIKKKCNAKKGQVRLSSETISNLSISQVGAQGPKGDTGPAGPKGQDGDSAVLCYGNISSDGTVLSFGGTGTTGVSVLHSTGSGAYDIFCTGTYGGVSGFEDITPLASATTSTRNAGIELEDGYATSTQLHAYVSIRRTDNNLNLESPFGFALMGPTP